MRKLRQDITLKEAWEAWEMDSNAMTITEYQSKLYSNMTARSHHELRLPVSFYEQLEVGSFGKFWDVASFEAWGHLQDILTECSDQPYLCKETCRNYGTFTPGLPEDVDADGMPK